MTQDDVWTAARGLLADGIGHTFVEQSVHTGIALTSGDDLFACREGRRTDAPSGQILRSHRLSHARLHHEKRYEPTDCLERFGCSFRRQNGGSPQPAAKCTPSRSRRYPASAKSLPRNVPRLSASLSFAAVHRRL